MGNIAHFGNQNIRLNGVDGFMVGTLIIRILVFLLIDILHIQLQEISLCKLLLNLVLHKDR